MLNDINGMTDRRLKLISKMGIKSIYELVTIMPRRYIDMDNMQTLASCKEGEFSIVKVRIADKPRVRYIRKNLSYAEMKVTDGAYTVECYWFNQPYMANKPADKEYLLMGKVSVTKGKRRFGN
ncbi:MAG: hypothetical protein IJR47_04280, partial [Clostridia bacterium]|nr:hypothetical protein [Clostridia bacterium]